MAALPNLEAQMQCVMHQLSWDVVVNPIVNVGINYQAEFGFKFIKSMF